MRDTTIDEIADGIFRISTFVPDVAPPAGRLTGVAHRYDGALRKAIAEA